MIKQKKWNYVLFIIVTAIPTFLSISWLPKSDITSPPWWAVFFSILSFTIGLIFLLTVQYDVCRFIRNFHKVISGSSRFFLEEFNSVVEEANSSFEQFKISIKKKEIITGTSLFTSFIDEIGDTDYKALIGVYYSKKRSDFLEMIAWALISVILIFSFFYIADYTLECAIFHRPGFECDNNIMQKGNIFYSFIDGLYYSVVTFTTLGYGDIHPGISIIAKIISITEVLIFIFFFGIVINIILSFTSYNPDLAVRNLKSALKEELEGFAKDI